MTEVQERRDRGTQRVPVSSLVEVCGSAGGSSVFEAESLDVSARGMHLRTAYLPEAHAPLVCRFENEGKEIVVEGKVAWRREGTRGGEFGVQFTALDSRSVDALSGLCEGPAAQQAPKAHPVGAPGARVRLHIDGLGSPMKARVKSGS
ncbi:MAG TPA: PilZ domain-containing protein, partial [Polyangiaceae bacterium]|nr:PilZ domain-containing protein [Polyangiaceae bacterium]